jgi:WD40 repeat protein
MFLPDGRVIVERRILKEGEKWRYLVTFSDITTGKEVFAVESQDYGCLSEDGRQLAVFSDGQTDIWDVPAHSRVKTLKCGPPITFSRDGCLLLCHGVLAAQSQDLTDELFLWEIPTGRLLHHSVTPEFSCSDGAFSPDARHLLVSGRTYGGRILTPEGQALFLAGQNTFQGLLKLWDVNDNHPILEVPGIDDCTFVLDGSRVATVETTLDGTLVRLWNTATGHEEGKYALIRSSYLFSTLRASRNGSYLAVKSVSYRSPRSLPPVLPRWKWLTDLWEQPGDFVSDITLYDVVLGQQLTTLHFPFWVNDYHFSPDGSLLAIAGGEMATVWQVPPHGPLWLAASVAAAFVGVVWAFRFGYRFRRRGAFAARRPALRQGI